MNTRPIVARRDARAVAATVLGILGLAVALLFSAGFGMPPDVLGFPVLSLFLHFGFAKLAAILFAAFGLPALLTGSVALSKINKSRGELSGKAWASVGAACGAILLLLSALLFVEPVSTRFETKQLQALLESVRGNESAWYYGDVIHDANISLGRIALKEGRVEEAKRRLLEAGKTPGSPVLGSYGPKMTLAKELFERGERQAVIEYLQLCSRFWESGRVHLEWWISVAKAGGTPLFDKSVQPPDWWSLSVQEAWRFDEVAAYGTEGTAPRRPQAGRTWLALLVEVTVRPAPPRQSAAGLPFAAMIIVDEAGTHHTAVAIAGIEPDGVQPKFLFLEEAFGTWREDPLPPSTVSPWGYSYREEAGTRHRSEIGYYGRERRMLFTIARDRQVKFPSDPAKLLLLFAPPAGAERLELRFGEHARAPVRVTATPPFEGEKEVRIARSTQACGAGDAKACGALASFYKVGWGVPKDLARAAALFKKACDRGDPDSCWELGVMQERGTITPKDPAGAAALYQKACDGRDRTGCWNLAVMYEHGQGVPKDLARAAVHFRQACDAGEQKACTKAGYMHEHGQTVPKDGALAAALYKSGCDGGDGLGCAYLGWLYLTGTGVPQDKGHAASLFKRGCSGGNEWACERLKTMPADLVRAESRLDAGFGQALLYLPLALLNPLWWLWSLVGFFLMPYYYVPATIVVAGICWGAKRIPSIATRRALRCASFAVAFTPGLPYKVEWSSPFPPAVFYLTPPLGESMLLNLAGIALCAISLYVVASVVAKYARRSRSSEPGQA